MVILARLIAKNTSFHQLVTSLLTENLEGAVENWWTRTAHNSYNTHRKLTTAEVQEVQREFYRWTRIAFIIGGSTERVLYRWAQDCSVVLCLNVSSSEECRVAQCITPCMLICWYRDHIWVAVFMYVFGASQSSCTSVETSCLGICV